MKRFRLVLIDYDTRAFLLTQEIKEEWEEKVKEVHRANKEQITKGLIDFFGSIRISQHEFNQ